MTILNQLRSEWSRGRRRPVEEYTSVIALVLGLLIPILMLLVTARNPRMRMVALQTLAFPRSVVAARNMAMLLGPLWAAALGANIVGAEYQYGTWPWLLVRVSSRARLLLVKILVVAAHLAGLTLVSTGLFVAIGAGLCKAYGVPAIVDIVTARQLLVPFISAGGAMAFASAIAFTVTVVSRSVVFGTLTGVLTLPLFTAIRVRETAMWIPYVHLENLQARLLSGGAPAYLRQIYEFEMSARASAGILLLELLIVLGIAFVVFRRQEIVY